MRTDERGADSFHDRSQEKKRKKAEEAEEEAEEAREEEPQKKKKKKKDKKEKKDKKAKTEEAVSDPEETAAPVASSSDVSAEEYRKKMQISVGEGSKAVLPDPVQSFESAPFGKKILKGLLGMGFEAPTAIQAQGWPVAVAGDDLIAVAKTGSGKTLAFLLPAINNLSKTGESASPAVLVLAPTRELAVQISESAEKFGGILDISSTCLYGGVPKPPQVKALQKKPPIVIATPGRLVDLMNDQVLLRNDSSRQIQSLLCPPILLIFRIISSRSGLIHRRLIYLE